MKKEKIMKSRKLKNGSEKDYVMNMTRSERNEYNEKYYQYRESNREKIRKYMREYMKQYRLNKKLNKKV